jgi:SanA protein
MIKKIILIFSILIIFVLLLTLIINQLIIRKSRPFILAKSTDLPQVQTALVLGAKVFNNGNLSDIFKDRLDTALELYNNKKVTKILVSGDHGTKEYDEVNAAKNYLLEKGVTPEDIFLDHAGFDTYDSLYRAKAIFEVKSLIITTQNFHLPRAVYLGNKMNIETYGLSADKHEYYGQTRNIIREWFARVKAWMNLALGSKPKYLGDKIPITGDGQLSWD